jgi:hypothetical protein
MKYICKYCKKEFNDDEDTRHPNRVYCSKRCNALDNIAGKSGKNHPRWKGGKEAKNKRFRMSAKGIYNDLKKNSVKRNREFPLERNEFIEWFDSKPKKCFYCGISEKFVAGKYKTSSGHKINRLTIDRIDNSKPYSIKNIVWACYRCNSIKSNFFTADEMKELAEKFIKPKMKNGN